MKKLWTTRTFDKQYAKLPERIQDKVDKQLGFLKHSIHHPSLNAKKMQNTQLWECRVDYHYRIVFELKNEQVIVLLFVGTHEIYKKVG